MIRIAVLSVLAVTTAAGASPLAASVGAPIAVPVRVYIVENLVMEKDGVVMGAWVTAADVADVALPEVNRIWREAGVVFTLQTVTKVDALDPPGKARLIEEIVGAQRDGLGKSDPRRIKKLRRLIDFGPDHAGGIDVYLIPYLGESSQGHAQRRRRRVYVGQWSDKASRGRQPPSRFPLTETRPFRRGSLSRTLAHELGHVLGLKHPDKATQRELGLLMGGKRPGYKLTSREIEQARRAAAGLSD